MALIIRIDVDRPYGRRPLVRHCTLPSRSILELLDIGRHEIGLHLENSRSFATFLEEMQIVEHHLGRKVLALSKHGSGGARFGFHHYAPYEPERYVEWARQASMRLFLGNLQDPSLEPTKAGNDLLVFPSAYWLEPPWRDTKKFTLDWLLARARHQDFKKLIRTLEWRIF